jgi:hypothetical protein
LGTSPEVLYFVGGNMPRVAFDDTPQVGVYSTKKNKSALAIAQVEFDLSTFRNPMGEKKFKDLPQKGLDKAVMEWMKRDPRINIIMKDCMILARDKFSTGNDSLPWLSFLFCDDHGLWTAAAVAELVADDLSDAGFRVSTHHHAFPVGVS